MTEGTCKEVLHLGEIEKILFNKKKKKTEITDDIFLCDSGAITYL